MARPDTGEPNPAASQTVCHGRDG